LLDGACPLWQCAEAGTMAASTNPAPRLSATPALAPLVRAVIVLVSPGRGRRGRGGSLWSVSVAARHHQVDDGGPVVGGGRRGSVGGYERALDAHVVADCDVVDAPVGGRGREGEPVTLTGHAPA